MKRMSAVLRAAWVGAAWGVAMSCLPLTAPAAWQAGLQGGTVSGTSINKTAMPAVTNVYLSPHVGATQTVPPWVANAT